MIEELKQMYKEKPKELIFRVLSYLSTSIVFSNIITVMFIIYMSNNGFFSYDFFIDGIFGMKLFFLVSIIFLFFYAIFSVGSLIAIIKAKKEKKSLKEVFKAYWVFFIFNFIILLMETLLIIEGFLEWEWILFLTIISLLICMHIGVLISFDTKIQFRSLLFVVFMIFCISIQFQEMTSKVVALGLKNFSIGGDVKAKVVSKNLKEEKGFLILMTPKFIFLKPENKNGIQVYPISNIEYIFINKDIKTKNKN